jgi:hypothetical protein
VPPGIRKKVTKACQVAGKLPTVTPKRQKRLAKSAAANLAQARTLASKAKRKLSDPCRQALLDLLR